MASCPCDVYQSPRSKMRIVSSPTSGRDLKKRMKPPSSSSYAATVNNGCVSCSMTIRNKPYLQFRSRSHGERQSFCAANRRRVALALEDGGDAAENGCRGCWGRVSGPAPRWKTRFSIKGRVADAMCCGTCPACTATSCCHVQSTSRTDALPRQLIHLVKTKSRDSCEKAQSYSL